MKIGSIIILTCLMIVNAWAQTTPPVITIEPVNVTSKVGQTATFALTATGIPTPTYQWYSSVNSGPFSAMAGQTNASRTTAPLVITSNGNRYYCIVKNSSGSVQSNTITLTVLGPVHFNFTINGAVCQSQSVCGTLTPCLSTCTNTPAGCGTSVPCTGCVLTQ